MFPFNDFFPPEIVAFVSERPADFTLQNFQDPFSVKQKKYLADILGPAYPNVFNIRQVHGADVLIVSPTRFPYKEIPQADGTLTKFVDFPLAVRTADCLPVFIYDPVKKAIGLVHAGWRGSRQKVVVHAVKLMREKWRTKPQDLKVAFGPAIQSCCYEVERRFKRYFPKAVIERSGRYYLDLPKVNRDQLLKAGVKAKNIYDRRLCTCGDPQFFSYRRDGPSAGRMISVLMMKSV
ncbi:MAG: peptidoglycan editing factor PgeF, partial [Candidatus Omnitrophota bacterium]